MTRAYIRETVVRADLKALYILDKDVETFLSNKDSFHGEFADGTLDEKPVRIFRFGDSRVTSQIAVLANMVQCEEHEMEPNTTMNFMSCKNCQEGLKEGLAKMPVESPDLYS